MSSLASMGPDRKANKLGGGGALRLDIRFSPSTGKEIKKSPGTIHVLVRETRQLTTEEPYVKLYLSGVGGKDIKVLLSLMDAFSTLMQLTLDNLN